ncbi:MAG: hypothetical protein ACOC41_03660 [Chitinivibrionales bacterium]
MKFKGNYFSISDNTFGCEISINEDQEKKDIYDTGNYLLLQRAYSEENDEQDCII